MGTLMDEHQVGAHARRHVAAVRNSGERLDRAEDWAAQRDAAHAATEIGFQDTGLISDEDEPECRICRCPAELPSRPLFHPCRCRGSIKYTHEDCLVQWLSSRPVMGLMQAPPLAAAPVLAPEAPEGADGALMPHELDFAQNQHGPNSARNIRTVVRCELCHTPFRFQPIYMQDTPEALPVAELLSGIMQRARSTITTSVRLTIVGFVWLFILPLLTSWTWQLMFVSSFREASRVFWGFGATSTPAVAWAQLSRTEFLHWWCTSVAAFSAKLISDALYGCALSAAIVFLFLGVSSLREYLRTEQDDWDDFDGMHAHDDHHHHQHHRGVQDRQNQNNLPLQQREQQQNGRRAAAENTELDTGAQEDPVPRERGLENAHHGLRNDASTPADQVRDAAPIAAAAAHITDDNSDEGNGGAEGNGAEDNVEVIGDVEHEVGGGVGGLEPAHDGHGAGAFLGLFDFDAEEVPLEEVIGLRGPLRNLVDNAGTVLVSNVLFLVLFAFVPLLVGQGTLKLAAAFSLGNNAAEFHALRPTVNSHDSLGLNGRGEGVSASSQGKIAVCGLQDEVLRVFNLSDAPAVSTTQPSGWIRWPAGGSKQVLRQNTEGTDQSSQFALARHGDFNDVFVMLLGYGVLTLACFLYAIVSSLLRSKYPRLLSPVSRQLLQLVLYCGTFCKVFLLLVFEFGLFPLGCGWWLDVCTLRFVGALWSERMAFCMEAPWTCHALHWILGIVYMVNVSLFVSLLREILRPELLWFLRNPDDPDVHPLRELVEKPLSRHMRRMTISLFIYAPLIILLVYVPTHACAFLVPQLLPFRLRFSDPLTEVPADLLLFHVCVPLASAVQHTNPRDLLRRMVAGWIRLVGGRLGLTELVLKDSDVQQEAPSGFDLADREGEAHEQANEQANTQAPHVGHDSELLFSDDEVAGRRRSAPHEPYVTPYSLWLRASCMIFLAWLSLVVMNVVAVTLPTLLGRSMFSSIGFSLSHDVYTFGAGLYTIWGAAEVFSHFLCFVRSCTVAEMLSVCSMWVVRALKVAVLSVLQLGVIPVGLGLLLELTFIIPFRVDLQQSAYFYLYQDWALGLIFLKLYVRAVISTDLNLPWREDVQRLQAGGFHHVDQHFVATLTQLVVPVIFWIAFALCLPYTITHMVMPNLFGTSEDLCLVAFRIGYFVMFCTFVHAQALWYLRTVLRRVHDTIRDDKYLLARRLHNYVDEDDFVE
ncbi:putative E3 ubiquitin ligase SUD1 [Porphyridium purpureum]|uniref:RING-type E3 ubiquitin transferase n=1 Tax=Porphyridium purpureum TaxID=35688 RepID=A0A5J4YXG3_PORPP|nr:putative E3 ubiquitin ligase SUD1 [Porphyridium purpureum]|eukprot:POR7073..scf209_3